MTGEELTRQAHALIDEAQGDMIKYIIMRCDSLKQVIVFNNKPIEGEKGDDKS